MIWLVVRTDSKPGLASPGHGVGPAIAVGSSMAWVAVRSQDPQRVADLLGISAQRSVDCAKGVAEIYDMRRCDRSVLVTPPINGWVLVAGLGLPQPLGSGFIDKCTPLLKELSLEFSASQYFLAYEPLDYFAWLRAENGQVRRAFAMGDEGVLWDSGRLTAAEKALGLKFFELRGVNERNGDAGGAMVLAPTETQVVALAGQWSVNPQVLASTAGIDGLGPCLLGRPSIRWRPERILGRAA